MKKTMIALLALTPVLFVSCAHHRDVRPGADGTNRVVVREQTQERAERDAIDQANHFCEQTNRHAAFVAENKTQYTGTMDEGTRDTLRKASTAASVLGAVGSGAGEGGTRTGGNVLWGAGTVGGIMTSGKDYLADMSFKCQ